VGKVCSDLPSLVKLVLQQFCIKQQPIPINFSFNDMCQGFLKWREGTTTSSSGKHLGMYPSIIRTMQSSSELKEDLQLAKTSTTCLKLQHALMTTAINHCHTYTRWKTVHNFLLEKTSGIPQITKL
jgi:hypothetical protein